MLKYVWRKFFNMLPEETRQLISRKIERNRFVKRYGNEYIAMSRFKSVQGFLLDEEAKALYDLTISIQTTKPEIVEIGSWLGKSAVVFGAALEKRGSGNVHCIDPFDASGDKRSEERYKNESSQIGNELFTQFKQNINNCGVSAYIRPHVGLSCAIAERWNTEIDLLFVDGDHSYSGVASDFEHFSPWVKIGGMVCFHDTWLSPPDDGTEFHEGPGEYIKNNIFDSDAWAYECHVGSLYCIRRVR